ncbi:MAG: hypothetical protein KBS52_05300 [Clostridiales bacterium]|nr:hypothetical protein [Candidatus Equinaster intestinalis]
MRKGSIGRRLLQLGNIITGAGLILSSIEAFSDNVFKIIVLVGLTIDIIAVFFIWKKSEF